MRRRNAFTLIEVIFVIAILGVVASIGSSIIVQAYEHYIIQRATSTVSLKTELAIHQIVNRLTHSIPSTLIVQRSDGNFTPLAEVNYGTSSSNNNDTLEWIGYDIEGFESSSTPGWSGFCNLENTLIAGGTNRIATPGSDLSFSNNVIQNLSGGTKTIGDAALLFQLSGMHDTTGIRQHPTCYGYSGNTRCIHTIAPNTTFLQTDNPIATNVFISQLYKLAWSAYAITPVNVRSATLFDLELRYNYQPWDGTQYNSNSTKRSILIRDVTSFKYAQQGHTIRLKLCATSPILNGASASVCKEKVVMR
jgi:prepilin-type N-terminal cleavage/methylation domain-containing protein